jgi:hypothetical protein
MLEFKRYSQAKLNMIREALAQLDRKANEHPLLRRKHPAFLGFDVGPYFP